MMNEKQKQIATVAGIIFVLMIIFPPFSFHLQGGAVVNEGYGFIFDPPSRGAAINIPTLLIQWLFVATIGGIAYKLSEEEE